MSENEMDPAANTQMFRAFVQEEQPQASRGRSSGGMSPAVVIGAVVVVIAVVVAAVWLAVS